MLPSDSVDDEMLDPAMIARCSYPQGRDGSCYARMPTLAKMEHLALTQSMNTQ
jgi:hypothetical protein